MTYDAPDGDPYESVRDYISTTVGLCGCADTDILDDLCVLLETFRTTEHSVYYDDVPIEGPDKYRELLLHLLDRLDWIDHGTSIRTSWMTDKGRTIADALHDESLEAK